MPRILAFHQVGNSSVSLEEQRYLFDEISADGMITPAIDRISQEEMKKECFSGEDTEPIADVFPGASPLGRQAITRLTKEIIRKLPIDGTSSTDFNCKDMLSGDFNRIFMSFGGFHTGIENGFIFDAADLVRRGARLRPDDMLYEIVQAAKRASARSYKDVAAAERGISAEIKKVLRDIEMAGAEALDFMSIYKKDLTRTQGEVSRAELVWDGPLSLALAVKAIRAGRAVTL